MTAKYAEETCSFDKNKSKVKIAKEIFQKEIFFGIIASKISTQVHKVTTGWI